ncbi:rubredoxin [Leptolyngbya sp. KIOST-1]|uniref:rubredoxin n=1 Tax=Leptolyngbya sp. KIOST-1 TaxID=1229172 RepID=UPI0009DF15B9|nr:rubredoxin [Leptolyngbya sp. KIOST-1]
MSAESEPTANSPEPVDARIAQGSDVASEGESTEVVELTPQEMDRYECLACGYSYEPTKGDSQARIPVGVAFEDLPVNWRCPVCSAPKKRFSNIGPAGAPSGFKENLNYGLGVNRLTPAQKNILIFSALGLGFLFFISLYGLK